VTFTNLLIQSISMHTKRIDMSQRSRNSPLPKKMHQGMHALRIINMKIPEHVVIGYIGARMSLVAAVHAGELDGVADEEDGEVVEYEILVAFGGEEACGPAVDVAHCVGGALLAGDGGDAL